jgi:signal transduction histidine kinase
MLLKAPEKREGAEFEQLLGFLVDGARKADALVNGLTNYAAALRPPGNLVPMSSTLLLKNAIARLAPEIRASSGEISYADLPKVTCDPDRMVQLFEHLLRNAIEHRGEAAARIGVSAREEGEEWIFAVADRGPGIDTGDLERIFRPFERLRKDRKGAGMGLAISREIVAGHGGRIWAESAVGEGTTVYFTLPA